MAEETKIGKITHYYTKLGVAITEISGPLKVGDQIHVKGHTSDFNQTVDSMEIEHKTVKEAKKSDVVGLKVSDHAREGDVVYKIA